MSKRTPPSSVYTRDYYLREADGYEAFLREEAQPRIDKALFFLRPRPDEMILDVGCGRGELLKECLSAGATAVGVDYSVDAVSISASHVRSAPILQATATRLPFKNDCFGKVALIDVTEHLGDDDLDLCLMEINRVLRPGGLLLIHTPNLWHHMLLFLKRLVAGDRERLLNPMSSDYRSSTLHVNEKSAVALSRVVRRAGFRVQVRTALQFRKNLGHLRARILDKGLAYVFGTYYLCWKMS